MSTSAQPGGDWRRERRWLGYAGLLPFLACLGVLWSSDNALWRDTAASTLRGYAAVIASFLGAVHWGVAAAAGERLRRARLRWGVMPALIAWTLLQLPDTHAFVGFALLFVLILIVDRYLLPVLDEQYRELRLQLSLVVIAALALTAWVTHGGSV